jgi:hypothetical protein
MMKKFVFLVLAFLATTIQTQAMDCCDSDCCWSDCLGFDSTLTFDVGGGWRQDNLQWKVFPATAPGTVVKEKWKQINMGVVETNAQFLACEHYLLKVDFDYGWFSRSGRQHVKNRDLLTDTLLQDFSSRTKGHVYDVSGGLGYQFNWCCYRYSFAPLVGYSYHYQKFKNNHYDDELAVDIEFDAHNTYKYRWRGPWLGFATAFQATCDWQLYFSYAYHWIRYRGTVDEAFFLGESTQHHKTNNMHGNEFTAGTTYQFCADWLLGLKVNYKNYSSNKGHVVVNDIKSDLRKLRWDALTVTVDIGYVF